MKSLGIGQGPEPQLVVKATQSATVVSASHLSFSARTQHADSTTQCTVVHIQKIQYITQCYNELFFSSSSMSNDLVSIDIVFIQLYKFLFGHIQKRSGISWQVSFKKGKYFYSAEYFWRASISLKWIKFVLFWAEYFPLEQARCSVPVISFFLGRLWHRAKKSPWTRAQLRLMMVPVWRWEQMRNLSTLPTDLKIHAIFNNSCFHFQECDWDQYAQWWNCFVQNPIIIIRVPLVGSTSVFASQQDPE